MNKRPLSVSVVAWIIIILSIIGIFVYITMHQGISEHLNAMNAPIHVYYMGMVSVVIDLICALFMLRGANWSRLLYLTWGIIIYIYDFVVLGSDHLGAIVFSIVAFIIFNIFLFSSSANEYFGEGKTTD